MKRVLSTFFALASVLSSTAQKANDSLVIEEVVIQSNRIQIPINQSSRNISIITKEQIKKSPGRSLNEILTYTSGVDVRQRGPFGTQTDISVDGGSFEQTLILLNGFKITDQQTAHNSMNLPVPVDAIERIEILRGAAARIYGVNALTGAINIVTKNPKEDHLFAHAFLGSNFKKDEERGEIYNGRGVQLGGSIATDTHSHQLYGSHESGTGYRYNTAYRNNRLFYQGRIEADKNNHIEAMAGWVRSSFGANGFYAAPGDVESEEIVNTTIVGARSNHKLSDKFTLVPQFTYRYNTDDYRYLRNDLSRFRSQHKTNSFIGEISGRYNVSYGQFGFGIEGRFDKIRSSNIGEHKRNNSGAYAEFRTREIKRLDITLGAYVNNNSVYGWQIFPGLDVNYEVNENLKVLFNTGSGQRIPSFTDLYLSQPRNIGNPNLVTENAYQTEIGLKFHKNNWNFKAIAFHRNIKDFIDWTRVSTDEPYVANNVGDVKTLGINTGIDFRKDQWNIGLHYTYLSPKFTEDQNIIYKYKIQSLKHQLVNTIAYSCGAFDFTIANRYQQRLTQSDYYLLDARVGYTNNKVMYYLDAQNLTDKTYIEEGAVPMPGRWFTVGIKFNY